MRREIKSIVISCLLASISFFVISCDIDDNDNGVGSGVLGKHLNLSGQVYEKMREGGYEKWNFSDDGVIYSELGGNGVLKKNGQFSFNIGTPNQYHPHFFWEWIYDNIEELNNFKISSASVQMALLRPLAVNFDSASFVGNLSRFQEPIPQTSKRVMEDVYFIYIDHDVNVSADKTNYTSQQSVNYTIDAFNHSLKAGWNAVYVKTLFEDNNTFKTFLHANPSHLKWTLEIITITPFQN